MKHPEIVEVPKDAPRLSRNSPIRALGLVTLLSRHDCTIKYTLAAYGVVDTARSTYTVQTIFTDITNGAIKSILFADSDIDKTEIPRFERNELTNDELETLTVVVRKLLNYSLDNIRLSHPDAALVGELETKYEYHKADSTNAN